MSDRVGETMKFTIKKIEIEAALELPVPLFPKYTTQLMNLANQNAGGTRPKIVGQMSELIVASAATSLAEWVVYYEEKHPTAVADASDKVEAMIENLREAMTQIDRTMIETWIEDLLLTKTFYGFSVQGVVLTELARRAGRKLTRATPEDEAKGIDGYLGGQAVSVKPHDYKAKQALPEQIDCPKVIYTKSSTGVKVDATELTSAPA